ncbi:MAG: metallophosphoesterase family protein [Xanthobacteraceae bacterium]
MSAFVLAHLSDPHLSPLPKPRVHELIGKRATGLANWYRKRGVAHRPAVLGQIVADLKQQATDHIAVTGDLINVALPGEFPPARAWLEMLGTPDDVTLVPGNHDAYVRRAERHRQAHWAEYMRGDEANPNAEAFPFLRRRGGVALIGVSSAVPSLPFMAIGRVGGRQVERLGPLLDASRKQGLFRVVMIHHPPTSKRAHYLKRLVDGALLRDTLARHGAELLIHGHNHRHQTVQIDGPHGPIPAIGVPSASETPPGKHDPAGYNLYRIEGEPSRWRCEVISRGFAADGSRIGEIGRSVLERN